MNRTFGWAIVAVALASGPALAQDRQDRRDRDLIEVTGSQPDTVFAAARAVRVEAEIADDLVAAGGVVTVLNARIADVLAVGGQIGVTATAAEDMMLAGGSVEIGGTTLDDLFAAGGALDLAADIRDDLIAAGGRVRTLAANRVGGTARLAGGDLGIEGRFAKDLYIAGGNVRLDAEVGGNVEIRGGRIVLGPATRIAGRLRYAADDAPAVASGAVVMGGIERMARVGRGIDMDVGEIIGAFVVFALAIFVGLGVVVVVLQAIMPGLLSDAANRLGARPWESLGIGIAVVIVTPPLLVLVAVTVVGLPLAALAGLLYFVLGTVALAVLAYGIGVWGRARLTGAPDEPPGWLWRAVWSLAGLGVIALVCLVPFVGWAVVMLALAAAVGALLAEARHMLA